MSQARPLRGGHRGQALSGAVLVLTALLSWGCGYADDADQPGTPDGIVLQKFPDLRADPLADNAAAMYPMVVWGFNDPLLIRSNTTETLIDGVKVPTSGRPLIYPRGRIATEYGITSKVLGPSPLGPMPGVPEGLKAMFGYQSRDGFRATPKFIPCDMDIAEAVSSNGKRELLVALAGEVEGYGDNQGISLNILPYRFVDTSAVALYRMPQPAPGQLPEIKHVLTYIHPGMVHDVDIEQWRDADGKNHIICLCGGNDDYTGRNARLEFMAANGMGAPPFSMNSPSIFYLSFYPKGPQMFADEVLSRLNDQPYGVAAVPDRGPVAIRFPREDAEFGYREGGVFHPFPSVDLTKWQGDMDYGFRRAPVHTEMPQRDNDQLAVHQIMSVELSQDGRIGVDGCVMYLTSPISWVPDAPGSLALSYQLTPEGIIR